MNPVAATTSRMHQKNNMRENSLSQTDLASREVFERMVRETMEAQLNAIRENIKPLDSVLGDQLLNPATVAENQTVADGSNHENIKDPRMLQGSLPSRDDLMNSHFARQERISSESSSSHTGSESYANEVIPRSRTENHASNATTRGPIEKLDVWQPKSIATASDNAPEEDTVRSTLDDEVLVPQQHSSFLSPSMSNERNNEIQSGIGQPENFVFGRGLRHLDNPDVEKMRKAKAEQAQQVRRDLDLQRKLKQERLAAERIKEQQEELKLAQQMAAPPPSHKQLPIHHTTTSLNGVSRVTTPTGRKLTTPWPVADDPTEHKLLQKERKNQYAKELRAQMEAVKQRKAEQKRQEELEDLKYQESIQPVNTDGPIEQYKSGSPRMDLTGAATMSRERDSSHGHLTETQMTSTATSSVPKRGHSQFDMVMNGSGKQIEGAVIAALELDQKRALEQQHRLDVDSMNTPVRVRDSVNDLNYNSSGSSLHHLSNTEHWRATDTSPRPVHSAHRAGLHNAPNSARAVDRPRSHDVQSSYGGGMNPEIRYESGASYAQEQGDGHLADVLHNKNLDLLHSRNLELQRELSDSRVRLERYRELGGLRRTEISDLQLENLANMTQNSLREQQEQMYTSHAHEMEPPRHSFYPHQIGSPPKGSLDAIQLEQSLRSESKLVGAMTSPVAHFSPSESFGVDPGPPHPFRQSKSAQQHAFNSEPYSTQDHSLQYAAHAVNHGPGYNNSFHEADMNNHDQYNNETQWRGSDGGEFHHRNGNAQHRGRYSDGEQDQGQYYRNEQNQVAYDGQDQIHYYVDETRRYYHDEPEHYYDDDVYNVEGAQGPYRHQYVGQEHSYGDVAYETSDIYEDDTYQQQAVYDKVTGHEDSEARRTVANTEHVYVDSSYSQAAANQSAAYSVERSANGIPNDIVADNASHEESDEGDNSDDDDDSATELTVAHRWFIFQNGKAPIRVDECEASHSAELLDHARAAKLALERAVGSDQVATSQQSGKSGVSSDTESQFESQTDQSAGCSTSITASTRGDNAPKVESKHVGEGSTRRRRRHQRNLSMGTSVHDADDELDIEEESEAIQEYYNQKGPPTDEVVENHSGDEDYQSDFEPESQTGQSMSTMGSAIRDSTVESVQSSNGALDTKLDQYGKDRPSSSNTNSKNTASVKSSSRRRREKHKKRLDHDECEDAISVSSQDSIGRRSACTATTHEDREWNALHSPTKRRGWKTRQAMREKAQSEQESNQNNDVSKLQAFKVHSTQRTEEDLPAKYKASDGVAASRRATVKKDFSGANVKAAHRRPTVLKTDGVRAGIDLSFAGSISSDMDSDALVVYASDE